GYDSNGSRIWEAQLAPDSAATEYKKPAPTDAKLLSFSEYEYDLLGRVTLQRNYVLGTTEAPYVKTTSYDDLNGTMIVTDRGVVTTTHLDKQDRSITTTLPDNTTTKTVPGIGSKTVTVQSNNGNITRTYNYDTRGLLLNVQDANGNELYNAEYDPVEG